MLAQIQGQSDPFSGKLTAKLAMGYADNVNAWPKNGVTMVGGLELPLPDPVNQKFDPVSDRVTEGLISFSGKQVLNEQRDVKAKFGFPASWKRLLIQSMPTRNMWLAILALKSNSPMA